MSTGQNPDYYPLTSIQEQLVDKLTDKPLASGVVYFFEDNARTIPKEVFTLDNNPQDYTYSSLGTSLTLSSIGTFNDSLGNNIIPYLYPFDAQGNKQLYYITVYNSGGVFQFSLGNLPFMGAVNVAPNPPPASDNYITNGQFAIGQNAQTITATSTPIAYGGWQFIKSSNLCATDTVAFPRFNAPLNGIPSGNPRYACRISTTTPNAGDSFKTLQIVFQDVNRFSDPNQQLTLFFSGLNNQTGLLQLNVDLYKNFGVGGSTPTTTPIGSMAFSNTGYNDAVLPFFFESNYGKTLGSGNDDYFAIQIQLPPTLAFDVSVTDFALFLGNIDVEKYPFTTNPIVAPTYSIKGGDYVFLVQTGTQVIPNFSITVPAGTYLINYTCFLPISIALSDLNTYEPIGHLWNNNISAVVDSVRTMTITANSSLWGGSGSSSYIANVTETTTFSLAATLNGIGSIATFFTGSNSITAVRIG